SATSRSAAAGAAASRPRGPTAKPAPPSSTTAPEKKAAGLRTTRPASSTSTTRTAAQSASETRTARSKAGPTDQTKHQPGGAKVGPTLVLHPSPPAQKCRFQGCASLQLQVLNKKLDLSKVTSKCGSKDNIKHKPGELSGLSAGPAPGPWSRDSSSHPPAGGGNVKIETHKVSFKEKGQSKVGSVDGRSRSPGGPNVKV
ncbi:unnamed protein product, partial [Tetraodon nigroviridis]